MTEEIWEEGLLFLWFPILFGYLEVLPPFVVEFGSLLLGEVRSVPQGLHHVVDTNQQLTYRGQIKVRQRSSGYQIGAKGYK